MGGQVPGEHAAQPIPAIFQAALGVLGEVRPVVGPGIVQDGGDGLRAEDHRHLAAAGCDRRGQFADQVLRGLAAADLKGEKKSGLRVHARAGQPCPECGDTIREVSFADSAFQYCPTCQTGGKPLADRRLSRLLK